MNNVDLLAHTVCYKLSSMRASLQKEVSQDDWNELWRVLGEWDERQYDAEHKDKIAFKVCQNLSCYRNSHCPITSFMILDKVWRGIDRWMNTPKYGDTLCGKVFSSIKYDGDAWTYTINGGYVYSHKEAMDMLAYGGEHQELKGFADRYCSLCNGYGYYNDKSCCCTWET